MLEMVEIFSAFGSPARLAGRALLAERFVSSGFSTIRGTSAYAETRFGKSYKWRPWLLLDIKDLEALESLINEGTDAQIEAFRASQLSVCGMIAIIGALVAQAGLSALQLPQLEKVHYVARGVFIMSLVMSLLAVFFAGHQQSSFGRATETAAVRAWLSSGTRYDESLGKTVLRSSMVSHMILHAPFEVVTMSIVLFVVGLGVYLGSGWTGNLDLNTGGNGNRAVLIAFIVPTIFVLLMFGHLIGSKDREDVKASKENPNFVAPTYGLTKSLAPTSGTDLEYCPQLKHRGTSLAGKTYSASNNGNELRHALRDAAAAYRECAKANEEVARRYEQLLGSH
ncbi:hypothetical protein AOQ84DRAFT_388114 [Glonium stellatum]|uniref:Uncharacterized protein n=1 Tax=Glonium stellatum TaxID=574774 RepID=A0A8E2F2S1_9PEZI|nr:hypothetical protein AOQ84DRAFT_388114 [Glonium stellatum]